MTHPCGTKNVTLYLFFLPTLRICLSIINSSKRQEFFSDSERIFLRYVAKDQFFSILNIDKYHLVSCISFLKCVQNKIFMSFNQKNCKLTFDDILLLYRFERNLLQEKASSSLIFLVNPIFFEFVHLLNPLYSGIALDWSKY